MTGAGWGVVLSVVIIHAVKMVFDHIKIRRKERELDQMMKFLEERVK